MAASARKKPGRKSPDLETLAAIVEQLKHTTARALAKKLGVSPMTIVRWRDQYAASNAPPPPPPPAAPVVEAPEPEEIDEDSLTTFRRLLASAIRRIKEAEAIGDVQTAQKIAATAADLSNTIARVEARVGATADTVSVPRADIETTMDGVRERVRAILDRPLLCASCSRALSVAWGREGLAK